MLSFQGSFEHLSCVNTVKVFGIDVFLAANKENSAIIARHLFMAAAYRTVKSKSLYRLRIKGAVES